MRKSGVYPRFFRVFGGFFTRKYALIAKAEELTLKILQKILAQIQKKFQDPYMRVDCEFFVK